MDLKLPTDTATYHDERTASFEEGWDAAERHYCGALRPHLMPLLAAVLDGAGGYLAMQRAALAISDILHEQDN